MKTKQVPYERQYELVMECRTSGLTDAQWCIQNGINQSTFSNWVSRLRKKTGCDIPAPAGHKDYASATKQEVVKLELTDAIQEVSSVPKESAVQAHTIEIRTRDIVIGFTNDVDPRLFEQALCCIGGAYVR